MITHSPPNNTWVGYFSSILRSQNSRFQFSFSPGVCSSLGIGTRVVVLLPALLLPVLLASVQSKDTVTPQVIDPSSMSSPLQVLPVPGGRRLTLAPPSPHHGGGGGGGGEDGSEGKREGRRESTLSFSLAVPTGPHHHPRRRESIAPCREACALMRYRFPAKLKSKT